ncbi:MBL fold hydrolase [Bacteroidia bacterium]|nr:MBL fold hydrolase [Bacteroidia bacterium]
MKITIHRGQNQIGGCITEIATATTHILIDLGHNLPNNENKSDSMANKEAVEQLTEKVDAIFYTHYHGDHLNLFNFVPKDVPQYIGSTAKKVTLCKYEILSKAKKTEKFDTKVTQEDVKLLNSFKTFQATQKIKVGDITITPFFVSHSACDAYMFLIKADGKRILHTGDFRQHGYLGKGLIPTIEKYIVNNETVDYLITEGTMLSRPDEKVKTEQEIQQEAAKLLKQSKYVFVLCSSTDIDRLASFYQASKTADRSFLVDGYQKDVLKIFTLTAGKYSECFQFKDVQFFKQGHEKQLAIIKKRGFCMPIRGTKLPLIQDLLKQLPEEETILIYSVWDGYLKEGKNRNEDYFNIWNMFTNREKLHTSGHASCETLAEVCNLVNPSQGIIPIHSEHSDKFKELKIRDELKSRIITESQQNGNVEIEIFK